MKKKIITTIIDILLLMLVFFVTDTVVLKLLKVDRIWLELCIYIICYSVVFGIKAAIVRLCKHLKAEKKSN